MNWDKQAIIDYARYKLRKGHSQLCFMMLDENVVAVRIKNYIVKFNNHLGSWRYRAHLPFLVLLRVFAD